MDLKYEYKNKYNDILQIRNYIDIKIKKHNEYNVKKKKHRRR